jgi:hypothetical protein
MSVIIDLQTVFHTQFVDMVMIYLHTRFHMPSSNRSLLVAVKLKVEDSIKMATTLSDILQNKSQQVMPVSLARHKFARQP